MKGLLRAINRSIKETVQAPDAAIDLLATEEPLIKKDIEKRRLTYVYHNNFINTPEVGDLGLGESRSEAPDFSDLHHRHLVRTAAHAEARRRVQQYVPAGQARPNSPTIAP